MYAVGLMSGTSLDGVDAALCEIDGCGLTTRIRLLAFATYPFTPSLTEKICQACFPETSQVDLICSLNFELGQIFSQAVHGILQKAGMCSSDLSFIASHGQTIYHQPFADTRHVASTLQIGEPAIMAYEHQCPVISDFRVMDMAAGGQGAPLVPYSEYLLYSRKDVNLGLLNIGGIANLTWLDGSMELDHVIAFDTGPGNMMINIAMEKLYQQPFDKDGAMAAKGHIITPLFRELTSDPYLQLLPPKSTGRELFGETRTQQLLKKYQIEAPKDVIYTLTYFTVDCIVSHIERFMAQQKPLDQLIVSGGGARNLTLMRLLKARLPQTEVLRQDECGGNGDAKEAMAFVVLGNETWHGQPSNVKHATGAKQYVVLGKITPAPVRRR